MRMRFAVHMIINMKVSGCEFPDGHCVLIRDPEGVPVLLQDF